MTCRVFPGYWRDVPHSDESFFTSCECAECKKEWPCPMDLRHGETVEVVDEKGTYRGDICYMVLNDRVGFVIGYKVKTDEPRFVGQYGYGSIKKSSVLWRRAAPLVESEDRFEREDVV